MEPTRDMQIFGENSPVINIPDDFGVEFKEYGDLLFFKDTIVESDIPLLESVRDWEEEIEIIQNDSEIVSESDSDSENENESKNKSRKKDETKTGDTRLDFLDRFFDIPRVKYMGMGWNENLPAKIVENGDLTVLKYVRSKNCPWNKHKLSMAAGKLGNLEILKYLHSEEGLCGDIGRCVVENGHLSCLEYLHTNGCIPEGIGKCLCYAAVDNEHFECLKYLHAHEYSWNTSLFINAIKNGNLEILSYLYENGCILEKDWDQVCIETIQNGASLSIFKYLHTRGYLCSEWTCKTAAQYGRLEILEYLHSEDCPWNELTCTYAAMHGHLLCLKYARENGCPWDTNQICHFAALSGSVRCLKYVRENGCPWGEWTLSDSMEWAHIDCCGYWTEKLCRDAENGRLECSNVKMWINPHANHEYDVVSKDLQDDHDHDCIEYFRAQGFFECLRYAIDNGCPLGIVDAKKIAFDFKNGKCQQDRTGECCFDLICKFLLSADVYQRLIE